MKKVFSLILIILVIGTFFLASCEAEVIIAVEESTEEVVEEEEVPEVEKEQEESVISFV